MTPKSGAEIRYFSKSEITSEEQRRAKKRGGGRGGGSGEEKRQKNNGAVMNHQKNTIKTLSWKRYEDGKNAVNNTI